MSQADAVAFLERLESDEEFAKELESIRQDPNAVIERMHAAGFDATPDEIREAFLDHYGAELTQEQLDQIAAGAFDTATAVGFTFGMIGVGAVAAAAAN